MSGRVVLVTGASRGIGLGLVRELLRVGGYQVVATCRFASIWIMSLFNPVETHMDVNCQIWQKILRESKFPDPSYSNDKTLILVFQEPWEGLGAKGGSLLIFTATSPSTWRVWWPEHCEPQEVFAGFVLKRFELIDSGSGPGNCGYWPDQQCRHLNPGPSQRESRLDHKIWDDGRVQH